MYNYRKLEGRIKEYYGTQKEFAKALHITEAMLTLKLNNKTPFSHKDMVKTIDLLKIPEKEIYLYFFTKNDNE